MSNQYQHNPAVYFTLRSVAVALAISGVVAAGYIAYISATGTLFNPIFRIPAWLFNALADRKVLPYSLSDFNVMDQSVDIKTLASGTTIAGVVYLLSASALTFYLVMFIGAYISEIANKYALKYKPGADGAEAYIKEKQEKPKAMSEDDTLLSDLDTVSREHFHQWKKYYKSDLSYEDWKKNFPV